MVAKLRSSVVQLRSYLTYANVMATVAVFLALGGAGAYAAKKKAKLAPNSVLSSHIRDGQVSSADIANGAVTGAKVLDGTLSGLDLAPDSLGPDEIDESSLGVVPQASSASTADTANAVGNVEARTIQFRKNDGDSADVEVLNLGGLVLTAKCATGTGEEMSVTATTTIDDASLISRWSDTSGVSSAIEDDFLVGDPAPPIISGNGNAVQGTLTYTAPGIQPSVVTVIYGGDEDVASDNQIACVFNGTAFHHLGI